MHLEAIPPAVLERRLKRCPVSFALSGRQKLAVAIQTIVFGKCDSRGLWELSSTVPAIDAPTLTREYHRQRVLIMYGLLESRSDIKKYINSR